MLADALLDLKGGGPIISILKRLASLELATGMQLIYTWVYTKFTPADSLSRDKARRDEFNRLCFWNQL